MVKSASFSDFRKRAAMYLDDVEKGDVVHIMRHGRHVADVVPIQKSKQPSWKKTPPVLALKGLSLSRLILKERKES